MHGQDVWFGIAQGTHPYSTQKKYVYFMQS